MVLFSSMTNEEVNKLLHMPLLTTEIDDVYPLTKWGLFCYLISIQRIASLSYLIRCDINTDSIQVITKNCIYCERYIHSNLFKICSFIGVVAVIVPV
jgi:hypothetical protein